MQGVALDLRHALRSFRRTPGATLMVLACLALGIGANTTVYSTASAFAFHPLPQVAAPERLVMLSEAPEADGSTFDAVSAGALADVKSESTSFSGVAAFTWWSANLTAMTAADAAKSASPSASGMTAADAAKSASPSASGMTAADAAKSASPIASVGLVLPERLSGYRVDRNFFELCGLTPALGRTFQPGDGPQAAVLGYGVWQRSFAADPAVVGRTVLLDGQPHTVIGVMPQGLQFPHTAQLWVPLELSPAAATQRAQRTLGALARLAPGTSIAEARAEVALLARRLGALYPEAAGYTLRLEEAERYFGRGPRPFMVVFVWSVAFVLLIACANVANLLLARATGRRGEMAVRVALGAGPGRLLRQLFLESLLLAFVGGALGVLLASWGVQLMITMVPPELHPFVTGLGKLRIDRDALLFTASCCLATAFLFGLAPALAALRTRVTPGLQDAGRSRSEGPRGGALRNALVVGEVALAVVLLVGASLTVQSFRRLALADPGFSPGRILSARLALPLRTYVDDAAVIRGYAALLTRLRSMPGVEAAELVSILPMSWSELKAPLRIEGSKAIRPADAPRAALRAVTPGYFAALGVPLREGRAFGEHDDAGAPAVAVVSASLARRFWPGGSAVGRRVRVGESEAFVEIVGVAGDVTHNRLVNQDPLVTIYRPLAQQPARQMSLVLRTGQEPASMSAALAREVAAFDSSLAAGDVRPLTRTLEIAASPQRMTASVLSVFAFVALALAAAGVAGVAAYAVGRRTHELGVRMALGARAGDVLRMVLAESARRATLGLALGLAGALALARALNAVLYGSGSNGPTFALIAAAVAAVALFASLVPALHAARIDPATALRCE